MKRIITFILTLAIIVQSINLVGIEYVNAAQEVKPVTHGNDAISFSVSENGHFSIRTTEVGSPYRANDGDLSLLYEDGENNTSFATFRIDDEDYIFGQDYMYSLSKKAQVTGDTIKNDDSIITTYMVGDGIKIQQVLSFVSDDSDTNYGNVYIRYVVNNTSGNDINIGARLLQDVMLGDNDGVAIKVEDDSYDKEKTFTGTDVPDVWRATDNEFSPNIVAYGYTNGWGNDKPDRMVVGHWQGLSESSYDYTTDSNVNFTMEGDYGNKDTAVAYYWEPKVLANNGTTYFESYYGLGQLIGTELTYATNIFAPTQMIVNEEQTAYTEDGEFEVAVMIENNLEDSEELYDVMAYLTLEEKGNLVDLDNDVALKGVKLIKKDGQYTFRWKLKATPGEDYNAIRYKVDLYDRRNVYKEGDALPEGVAVGDVKLDEIYSVSKALILPSKTGAPPSIGFESLSPDEIYYSGKNLVTMKTTGTSLLVEKSNWALEYRINGGIYQVVPSELINVVPETNSLEVVFEQSFDQGEMEFRMRMINDIYTDGTKKENILKGDILYVPGALNVTKDKAAMQRTYGMLALVEEKNDGHSYTIPFVVADEDELKQLKAAIEAANVKDGEDREVVVTISGDVRSIREDGKVARYVVYAQHKKAFINDLMTYTSSVPMTIEYESAWKDPTRDSIDYQLGNNTGLSSVLKSELDKTEILTNMSPEGSVDPGLSSDVDFDFPYVSNVKEEMTEKAKEIAGLSSYSFDGITNSASKEFNDGKVGRLTVTGMGVLGINSKDGFDFWMDKFNMEFVDDTTYSLDVEDDNPIRVTLGGVGSVLNKVFEGMPVQIGGVRLVKDDFNKKEMLTFDATVDLTFLPTSTIVEAEDVFFSQEKFEGLVVDASIENEEGMGVVNNFALDVGVDTYRNKYNIKGSADVGKRSLTADVEFSIVKERRNNKWYLDNLVLAGGGDPGIPVVAGSVYIYKLGGGVRNLQQITNPYYDGGGKIFTVVLIAGVNVVEAIKGEFEGEINKRGITVTGDEAELFEMDILRDLQWKLRWGGSGEESDYFYLSEKGSLDIEDIIVGSFKMIVTKSSFEGTAKAAVKIPDNIPLVGGHKVGKASLGLNLKKIWGSVGVSLPYPLPSVKLGTTYYWRGKFDFNVGEAGPVIDQPDSALYYGSVTDENNQTIDYVIGTNVKEVDGNISENGIQTMVPLTILKDNDDYATFTTIENASLAPDDLYVHEDGATMFDGKYVYSINLDTTDATNLVLKHQNLDTNNVNNLKLYAFTGNVVEEKDEVTDPVEVLSYVEHVIGEQEYVTVTGFGEKENVEYLVVSETPLSNYLTYTDGEDYAGFENGFTYKVTLDTTANTRLAFTYDDDVEIDLYRVNNANADGLKNIEKDSDVIKKQAQFSGKHILVFEGFPDGESNATYYISASKALTEQNILGARAIEIPETSSEYGSTMVAQLLSETSIDQSEVFYITDESGTILDFFEEGASSSEDENYNNLFNEMTIDGKQYYSMIYPFESAGTYYIYSTTDIDIDASQLFEIETIPELTSDQITVKPNAQSDQKRDVYWEGKNYRYRADVARDVGKTLFTYYLADDELTYDEDGEPIYLPERVIESHEAVEGEGNLYTVDIPRDVPTGDYRILMVMSTEGLSQEFAYSDAFNFVNPNMPKAVTDVAVETSGNGYFHVKWSDDEDANSYYIEVFDENNAMINAFGTAEIDGDQREAIIGGIYENFDPNNPENGTVTGLETGKNYVVGITPVKKIDETFELIGTTAYSDVAFLPEPDPATISLSFTQEGTYTRTSEMTVVAEDGTKDVETIEVVGTNQKSPSISVVSDQLVSATAYLNQEEVDKMDTLSNEFTVDLSGVTEGLNYLDVVVKNENGDVSYDTLMFYVDSRAPELMISEPLNNTIVEADATTITVSGKTEFNAEVSVNGQALTVNKDGYFTGEVPLDLSASTSNLEIKVSDDFDNETISRMEILRNLEPITGIDLASDVPVLTQTVYRPVYEQTTEKIMNPFTNKLEEVPMSASDEVVSFEEDSIATNVVEMGEEYHIQVSGHSDNATNIPLESSKVAYNIVDGAAIGTIDDNGKLSVKNSGTMVIEVSYSMLADENGKSSFAYKNYFTVTSAYKDVYVNLPDAIIVGGDFDDGSNNGVTHSSGGSSSSTASNTVSDEVTVKGENGSILTKLIVKETQDAGGAINREVTMTEEQAKDTTKNLKEKKETVAKIYLPDNKSVEATYINIPKESLDVLQQSNVELKIESREVTMDLSKETIKQLAKDMDETLHFNLKPLPNKTDMNNVIKQVEEDEAAKKSINGATFELQGQPMYIETNMVNKSNVPVELVLPIDEGQLPSDYDERIAYLKGLTVYIIHDDGEKEILPVEIVALSGDEEKLGAKFAVTKFSVFTLFEVDGWDQSIVNDNDPYMNGYADGTFKPLNPITRAELAAIMDRVTSEIDGVEDLSDYNDVDASFWAHDAIVNVRERGIINGYEGNEFHPNSPITRAEMATIAVRWLGLEGNPQHSFTDISGSWAENNIALVTQAGIFKGYDDGRFNPNGQLTRSEAAAVINRILGREPVADAVDNPWKDVDASAWYYETVLEATIKYTYIKGDETDRIITK